MPTPTTMADRVRHDLGLTRELLERLPDASMDWRPHARAFTLAGLATHLAQLPHWGIRILTRSGYDLEAAHGSHVTLSTRGEILAAYDRNVAAWRDTLATVSDDALSAPWELRRGPRVVESLSRTDAAERYLLHHLIHHRGQLTVYLRLLDVPLPALYGPTADDRS